MSREINKYNIIADVAGRYNELMKLVEIMPTCDKIILVGDLVDRGPDSKKVVEWAMTTPNVITLKGNHEDMMIAAHNPMCRFDDEDHLNNGGEVTLKSYGVTKPTEYPKEHIEWMINLPLFFKDEGLFVSHAPWIGPLEDNGWGKEYLWNRLKPNEVEGVYQIFGHNSRVRQYGNYAMCIDNCGDKELMGLTWPDKKVFAVKYE